MYALKIFVLAAYFFIAYLTVIDSKDLNSRSKMLNDNSFATSSNRYGRSSSVPNRRRPMLVVPKIDKFFLSSRYGKRSTELSNDDHIPVSSNLPPFFENLSCSYTGYSNLYRCAERFELVNDEFSPDY